MICNLTYNVLDILYLFAFTQITTIIINAILVGKNCSLISKGKHVQDLTHVSFFMYNIKHTLLLKEKIIITQFLSFSLIVGIVEYTFVNIYYTYKVSRCQKKKKRFYQRSLSYQIFTFTFEKK